ncbi:MAG: chorismate-binding protein [Paludibacter sp.]
MKLTEIQNFCLTNNIAFFSYRLPYSNQIVTGIQLSQKINSFVGFENKQNGFVIMPFDSQSTAKPLFIQSDISFIDENIDNFQLEKLLSIHFEAVLTTNSTYETSKEDYLLQANSLINQLKNKELVKIVLSRAINSNLHVKSDAPNLFDKLTKTYPHAFVSFFNIPGVSCWIGATPETLLKSNSEGIQTMSLAGTKSLNTLDEWTDKEREEQQMVSDFVENVLRKFSFSEIEKDGPFDQNAGNVSHLMTKYYCKGKLTTSDRYELIKKLHPTPAVCGIPREKAYEMIRMTEQHDREYYAGFLGPINAEICDLFVNLRCMKLTDEGVSFFVGGGLTAQSQSESEWKETCMKLETLSKVIES